MLAGESSAGDASGVSDEAGKRLAFGAPGGMTGMRPSPFPSQDDAPFVYDAVSGEPALSGSEPAALSEFIEVDRAEMLRYLGYAGQEIDPQLSARIEDAAALCQRESSPRFVWRAFPLRGGCDAEGNPVLRLEGSTLELPGDDILEHLKGAVECVAMACTLGLSNEREARRLAATDPTMATLFSAAGSALVETVADLCSEHILQDAKLRGLTTGSRFSPGYGDLPLAVQPQIVRVLKADKRMGMAPTEGGFVIPSKSVTALVGLFEAPRREDRSFCDSCRARERCVLRKAGTPCNL